MKLAALFSDGMILQQGQTVKVWGWDTPGNNVTVALNGSAADAVADAEGRFICELPAMDYGGPYEMRVCGSEEIVVVDILVGEVWLCSGQSNMEWALQDCANGDAEVELADYPQIRLFQVPTLTGADERVDLQEKWQACTPAAAAGFSGVGYFFGRELHRTRNVSIGLINASVGGTRAEAWTSREKLLSMPHYAEMIAAYDAGLENLDEALAAYAKAQTAWEKENLPADPGNNGFELGYADTDYDDSAWREMEPPGSWQSKGENYSGVFWFRREIDIPQDWDGKQLLLSLGELDKWDETYFNGEKVGGLSRDDDPNAWIVPRRYTVPGNLVKPGRAIVATRVFSHMYAGGFVGQPTALYLSPAGDNEQRLPLTGAWNFHVEHDFGFVDLSDLDLPEEPMGPGNQNSPSVLFRNMINPLVGYGIRGTIWYQGESNAWQGVAMHYHQLFSAMIADWREQWGYDFPFYFVQLANFAETGISEWPILRQCQTDTLQVPGTGMAVIVDIGESNDIHPRNKQDVGKRLSLIARHHIHGEDIEYSGPVAKAAEAAENGCRITFSHAEAGLKIGGDKLVGFEVAGDDGSFSPADATIEGAAVLVTSELLSSPETVRYAWAGDPVCNLYNNAGLPAAPFLQNITNA
ncbi:MAG: sialate O-acetylesterase [Lentisphaeria bacterium]